MGSRKRNGENGWWCIVVQEKGGRGDGVRAGKIEEVYKRQNQRFFFFKQKAAYEIASGLVGSERCRRDRARIPPLHSRARLSQKKKKKKRKKQLVCEFFYQKKKTK